MGLILSIIGVLSATIGLILKGKIHKYIYVLLNTICIMLLLAGFIITFIVK